MEGRRKSESMRNSNCGETALTSASAIPPSSGISRKSKRRTKSETIYEGYDTVDAPIPPDDIDDPGEQDGTLPHTAAAAAAAELVSEDRVKKNHTTSKPRSSTMPNKLPSQETSRNNGLISRSNSREETLPDGQARCGVCQKRFKTRRSSDHSKQYVCRGCGGGRLGSKSCSEAGQTCIEFGTFEKCEEHDGSQILSFCADHCCLCCDYCEKSSHKQCPLVTLEKLLIKEDTKQVKQNTDAYVRDKLQKLLLKRRYFDSELNKITQTEFSVKEQIQHTTRDLVESLRNMETDLLYQVDLIFEKKKKEYELVMEDCKKYLAKLTNFAQELEQPNLQAVSRFRSLERIKRLEKEVGRNKPGIELILERRENTEDDDCKFELNETLKKAIHGSTSIGNIVFNVVSNSPGCTQETKDQYMSSCSEDTFKPLAVETCQFLSTWCRGDVQNKTDISCIKLLHNNDIMVCDIESKTLKWFKYDGETFNVKGTQRFDSSPWFIDRIRDNRYIVTLPNTRSFVVMEVGDRGLMFEPPVDLGHSYYSVCCVAENSIVFAKTSKTHFLTTHLDGTGAKPTFSKSFEEQFSRPNYLLYSSDSKTLFINDPDTGVYGVRFETKEMMFRYKPRDLICPLEIELGKDGSLVIVDGQSNKIHCISKYDGEFRNHITLNTVQESLSPQCICYLPHTDEYLLGFARYHKLIKFHTDPE